MGRKETLERRRKQTEGLNEGEESRWKVNKERREEEWKEGKRKAIWKGKGATMWVGREGRGLEERRMKGKCKQGVKEGREERR